MRHDPPSGKNASTWNVSELNLRAVNQLVADPYDGSVWLDEGTRTVHIGTDGKILADIETVGYVDNLALAADQSVWFVGADGQLAHYDPHGARLASVDWFGQLRRTDGRHIAIDSLRNRIWLWDTRQAVQLDANSGVQQRSFAMPPRSIATVLDPRSGTLWTLSDERLTAFPTTGFAQITDLHVFGIAEPQAIAYDAANDCLWVGDSHGLSRFDFMPENRAALWITTPAQIIAAAPFAISPALTLLQPGTNARLPNGDGSLVFGVDALCYGSPCAPSADYLKGYRLDAILDGENIGDQFQFDFAAGPSATIRPCRQTGRSASSRKRPMLLATVPTS